jgi:hypothetical protein
LTRLFLAISLAVLCFAPALASAERPWRPRSDMPSSIQAYDDQARQRRHEWRRRLNDLDTLDQQLENSRSRARIAASRRPDRALPPGARSPLPQRAGYSALASNR